MHKGPETAKKASTDAAYQDSVTAPLSRANDEDITGVQDEEDGDEDNTSVHPWASDQSKAGVLTAVEKVNLVL
jgi:hypothetical protein